MSAPTVRADRSLFAACAVAFVMAVLIGQSFATQPYLLRLPFAAALSLLVLRAGLRSDWVRR